MDVVEVNNVDPKTLAAFLESFFGVLGAGVNIEAPWVGWISSVL
jgi:hypothetical protein